MKNHNFFITLMQAREHIAAAGLLQKAGLSRYSHEQLRAAARLLALEAPDDAILAQMQADHWPASGIEADQQQRYLQELLKQLPVVIYPRQIKRWVWELGGLLLLIIALVAGSAWVETAFIKHYVPAWDKINEEEFHDPVAYLQQMDKGVWFWVDFGKERQLHNIHLGNGEIQIKSSGFSIGPGWSGNRQVNWYMQAAERGQIELTFTPHSPYTVVMVFMTDGDSTWRMSHLESKQTHLAASDLRNGRWYIFPLSAQELASGHFVLKLFKIMGKDIAVSSLVVIYDDAVYAPGGIGQQKQWLPPLPSPSPPAKQLPAPVSMSAESPSVTPSVESPPVVLKPDPLPPWMNLPDPLPVHRTKKSDSRWQH